MSSALPLRADFLSASHTQANAHGDFMQWHRGRPWFWFWAIDAALPAVVERVRQAQQSLAPYLLEDYVREPHVTLSLCGFPAAVAAGEEEYGRARWQAQCHALQQLAPSPFVLQVGGLDSFRSAPFLQLHDPAQRLQPLRQCLTGHPQDHAAQDYVPHVTVGLYARAWPTAALAVHLRAFSPQQDLALPVERLSLMRYASHEVGGRLTTVADYCLRAQRLVWRAGFMPAWWQAGAAAGDCCR